MRGHAGVGTYPFCVHSLCCVQIDWEEEEKFGRWMVLLNPSTERTWTQDFFVVELHLCTSCIMLENLTTNTTEFSFLDKKNIGELRGKEDYIPEWMPKDSNLYHQSRI